ncbi:hypothetical protein EBX31_03275 [bacterium]|nr:hypothetical protein [bacterium]
MFDQNLIVGLIVLAVVVLAIYAYAPKVRAMLSGMRLEGFQDAKNGKKSSAAPTAAQKAAMSAAGGSKGAVAAPSEGAVARAAPTVVPAPAGKAAEGFADYAAGPDSLAPVPMAAAAKPAGCYPREQLNPMELLPADVNSQWAQVNPTGAGDIQGKNFLSAGALVGVNTVGQSLRNPNYQLRSEPPNPQMPGVSPWLNSTIEPDLQRRPLE